MTNEMSIVLKNLTIKSKKTNRILVNDVSLAIPKGSVVGIVGESGSGKSLTMKSIMGILPNNLSMSKSEFTCHGRPVNSKESLPISMIFQDPMTSLNPLRTIGYHLIEISQRYHGMSKKEAYQSAIQMLEKVGITQAKLRMEQFPFELSGGMRQRVMIAMALLSQPEVLIADEPTTALDVTIQLQILSLIAQLKQEMELSVVLVSHDFGVIASMCDYVIVMYQGQVVEEGTVLDIFEHASHPYTQKLLSLAKFDMSQSQVPISSQKGELVHLSDTHKLRMEGNDETITHVN
ncbi:MULTISPECIES: ABC transporter ATP-binding protein [unclassified Granulicatella]|uniref:ABC transporter ATP-binding protein n=1 Tax=unclassified Granulicatella TaxID=2630493 RepID=UPI0010746E69|nr:MULTISPECIES: ABC transporter ATP-binding protein [unclassified Granulicatella]MBF0779932.1 ABC transporter ATP-binding protein [Granulicatella sp. 19428wC4_WM01]TFU96043.1 ABC transporter ATP-binding protein [Granulicatella sp. WM01]